MCEAGEADYSRRRVRAYVDVTMTPEWKDFIVAKVQEVRELAEKHTKGWPVNVFYEGLTGGGMNMSFKVTAMELPTSAKGNEVLRPISNIETGEYTFWMKTPRGMP